MALSKKDKNTCVMFLDDLSKAFYYGNKKFSKFVDLYIKFYEIQYIISDLHIFVSSYLVAVKKKGRNEVF